MSLAADLVVSLAALIGVGLAVLAAAEVWRLTEQSSPGRPLRIALGVTTFITCAATVANNLGTARWVAELNFQVWTIVLAGWLTAGALWTWSTRRVSHRQVHGMRLAVTGFAVLFVLQLVALHVRDQWAISNAKLLGLTFLPALVVVTVGTGMSPVEGVRFSGRLARWVVWVSLVAWVAYPTAVSTEDRRVAVGPFVDRVGGITPHPTLLAITCVVLIVTAVAHRERGWPLHTLGGLAALFLTESRISWIGLLVVIFVTLLTRRFQGTVARVTGLVGAAAGGALYVATHPDVYDFEGVRGSAGLASNAATLNGRTDIWDLVLDNADTHLLGWGPMAFDPGAESPFSATFYLNAHNQFVEALAETGWLGVLAVAMVAVTLLRFIASGRGGSLVTAASTFTLVTMVTEVPFTVHLYGSSYTVVVAAMLLLTTLGAARTERTPKAESATSLVASGAR